MEYRLGNFKKVKTTGKSVSTICPKCDSQIDTQLFYNGCLRLKSDFPLLDGENIYFLVCPHCSAIHGVNSQLGNKIARGKVTSVDKAELKELQPFDTI